MATQLKPEPEDARDTAGSSAPARPASRGPSRAALRSRSSRRPPASTCRLSRSITSEGEDSAAFVAQVTRAASVADCFRSRITCFISLQPAGLRRLQACWLHRQRRPADEGGQRPRWCNLSVPAAADSPPDRRHRPPRAGLGSRDRVVLRVLVLRHSGGRLTCRFPSSCSR